MDLNNNSSSSPIPPRNQPSPNGDPNAYRTSHGPESKAPPAMTLAVIRAISVVHGILVPLRIDQTPDGGSGGWNHGNDTPVGGKVLDSPDDRDDNRDERKGTAVAETNQGCGKVGESGVVEKNRGGEKEIADGEEEGGGEEKCKAGEGGAIGIRCDGGRAATRTREEMSCWRGEEVGERAGEKSGNGRGQRDGADMG